MSLLRVLRDDRPVSRGTVARALIVGPIVALLLLALVVVYDVRRDQVQTREICRASTTLIDFAAGTLRRRIQVIDRDAKAAGGLDRLPSSDRVARGRAVYDLGELERARIQLTADCPT